MKNIFGIIMILGLVGCMSHTIPPSPQIIDPEAEYIRLEEVVTKYLKQLEEPIFEPPYDENIELYRFLWLRAFHQTIVIRVFRSDDDHITLIGKQSTDAKETELGGLERQVEKQITSEQWNNFQQLLHVADFWEMPSIEPSKVTSNGAVIELLDGSTWVLEGIQDGRRHLVKRRFIMDPPEFEQACLYLLSLPEIPVPPEQIY